jgi:putative addiction module component (TIGR02574 family)
MAVFMMDFSPGFTLATVNATGENWGMTANVQELLQTALKLSENERADLAASLIESLDQPFDADAREAWAEEIHRRLDELDSGAVKPIPWDEARQVIAGSVGRSACLPTGRTLTCGGPSQ